MAFSCKIILAERPKENGQRMVYLQAIIDRKRAIVPLKFYLNEKEFDERRQIVKNSHPNEQTLNTEILVSISKAITIASKYRIDNKHLTPQEFKNRFLEPSRLLDVIKFFKEELESTAPDLEPNTIRQHHTVINKLDEFRLKKRYGAYLMFSQLNPTMMQAFKNFMRSHGNVDSTIDKNLKIVKQYLSKAEKMGIRFDDPFMLIKIKTYRSNRLSLSQKEVDAMATYYNSPTCETNHKQFLRYFLFSCYTGLRISDIKVLTWNNVHDNVLSFIATKGKRKGKVNKVPINQRDKELLPPFQTGGKPIFKTFAEASGNKMLKKIASRLDIRKKITYHVSRHTFGSLFAEGGNIVALQKIMGHGDIKTTMGYVHTSTKNLIDAKTERFGA